MPLSEATKNTVKKLSVNELLTYYMMTYICFYRNNGNAAKLHSIILTQFSPSDICDAKKTLVNLFWDHLIDGSVLTERRSSTIRSFLL